MKKKDNKGFTLIEVLIVIAIIGILFAVLVPRINVGGDKAKEAGVKTDFRSYEIAVEQVMIENSGLPDDTNGKTAFSEINKVLDSEMFLLTGEDEDGKDDKDNILTAKSDPWKKQYNYKIDSSIDGGVVNGVIKAEGVTDHYFAIRSGGKDAKLDDDNDYILVVHYKDGKVKTCTKGLSNDIGEVKGANWAAIEGCN